MIESSLKKLSNRITKNEIEHINDCYQLALVFKKDHFVLTINLESIEYDKEEFDTALQDFLILKEIMEKNNGK